MRRWLDPYLLALLSTVALAVVLPPPTSLQPVVTGAADLAIALLFLVYGIRLARAALWTGLRSWRLHLTVLSSTFLLFPVLGVLAGMLLSPALPAQLRVGVVFLSLLPSTVQSSIAFTSIAGGDVPAAICAASLSNVAGVVVTPLLAALTLGSSVDLSLSSLGRIGVQILLPFALGQLLHPRLGRFVARRAKPLALLDRGSVVLVVFAAFGEASRQGIWRLVDGRQLASIVVVDVVLLAVVLTLTAAGSRLLGFPLAQRIVVTFCGSKKSIATGVPVAAVIFAKTDVALIVLSAMVFHQVQLMTCAVLARRYRARQEVAGVPEAV